LVKNRNFERKSKIKSILVKNRTFERKSKIKSILVKNLNFERKSKIKRFWSKIEILSVNQKLNDFGQKSKF